MEDAEAWTAGAGPGGHDMLIQEQRGVDVDAAAEAADHRDSDADQTGDNASRASEPSEDRGYEHLSALIHARNTLDHVLSCGAVAGPRPWAAAGHAAAAPNLNDLAGLSCTPASVDEATAERLDRLKEAAQAMVVGGPAAVVARLRHVFGAKQEDVSGPGVRVSRWSPEVELPLSCISELDAKQLLRTVSTLSIEPPAAAAAEDAELVLHVEDIDGAVPSSEIQWTSTQQMTRHIRQALQRADRVMPRAQAKASAADIVTTILFCLGAHEHVVSATLKPVLEQQCVALTHGRRKQGERSRRHVRLRLGCKQWRVSHFGLGFIIQTFSRLQLRDPSADDGTPAFAELLCSTCFSFPVKPNNAAQQGAGDDIFCDAASSDQDAVMAERQLDLSSGSLVLQLGLRPQGPGSSDGISDHDSLTVLTEEGSQVFEDDEGSIAPAAATHRSAAGVDRPADSDQQQKNDGAIPARLISSTRPLVAEVYGWGDNKSECLGLDNAGLSVEPQALPLCSALPVVERVVTVALSDRHVMVLTMLGSVYTCGDGTDGALGHGDLVSHRHFRLVDAFMRMDPMPFITAVAAGSDILGTHSAAIDSEGGLYTWGFGPATGHNVGTPVEYPKKLEGLPAQDGVDAVACGGAFCLALTRSGRVWSWGLWAHGRLGIGPPPVHTDRYRRRKVTKYKLRPALVRGKLGSQRVVRIAAGLGHSLVLTDQGQLYAWGRDDLGQLGLDVRSVTSAAANSLFASVFEPELVASLGSPPQKPVDVACGAFHSVAIDETGHLWTWGGAGGPALGHGEHVVNEPSKVDIRALLKKQSAADKQLAVFTSKPAWASPRRVSALEGVRVQAAAAGMYHSAVVTDDGRLFLWGESASTLKTVRRGPRPRGGEDDKSDASDDEDREEEEEDGVAAEIDGVQVPRQPCAVWLPQLAGKWTEAVACSGHNTLVVCSGDRLGRTLGATLLDAASQPVDVPDDATAASWLTEQSYMTTEAGLRQTADLMLLVSGRVLYAHKLVLARRSPMFRELIAAEEWPGENGVVQLLLPDLRYDVARALLLFLYTDNLPFPLDFRTSLPLELMVAARSYQIPRLEAICRSVIQTSLPPPSQLTPPPAPGVIPASTMSVDLGACLGDYALADVKFVASGRVLLAHRTILSARSEYFRAMFRSGMREGGHGGGSGGRMVEVVVPDSYDSLMRILFFIYSGCVAVGRRGLLPVSTSPVSITSSAAVSEAALEDLAAADRYRLLELKSICESLVEVDADNCLEVLEAADIYSASCLREAALYFIVGNLDKITETEAYSEFAAHNPTLVHNIYEKLKATSPHTQGFSVAGQDDDDNSEDGDVKKREEEEEQPSDVSFPWAVLGGLVVCGLVFRELSQMVALGPFVPALNIILTVGLVVYGVHTLQD